MATYEPLPREYHTSAPVASKVLVYSGRTQDDSVQNRERLQSIVELYDPHTRRWEAKQCTGEAPVLGVYNAASAWSNDVLYMYGGRGGDRKLVNSLYQMSAGTYCWSKLSPKNTTCDSPIPKCGVGMVACGDNLALLGGFGLPHGHIQAGSSFIKKYSLATDGRGWTNEFHIFHLKEGMWTRSFKMSILA